MQNAISRSWDVIRVRVFVSTEICNICFDYFTYIIVKIRSGQYKTIILHERGLNITTFYSIVLRFGFLKNYDIRSDYFYYHRSPAICLRRFRVNSILICFFFLFFPVPIQSLPTVVLTIILKFQHYQTHIAFINYQTAVRKPILVRYQCCCVRIIMFKQIFIIIIYFFSFDIVSKNGRCHWKINIDNNDYLRYEKPGYQFENSVQVELRKSRSIVFEREKK